jgi:sec-independent protein translocase protein TatA
MFSGGFSIWHWLIVGLVVLLLFGKGRFSDMMGDVAKGLKSFKKGMSDDEEAEERRRLTAERPIEARPVPPVPPAAQAEPGPVAAPAPDADRQA